MFRAFYNWLDHRTGIRKFVDLMLLEHIPGGAKWRYVWGSTLAFVFALQVITGIMLMTAYSPSKASAWGSVMFIQYEMDFGWLIRGLHHFGSSAMIVLLALHMLQVVIAGAHLPPREINWWLGLGLLGIVLAMGLTGYLLPWDQKGYFATRVATNIAKNVPVVGPPMQRMLVGGPEYGNATLTRFFALHVAILPATLIILLIAHIVVFRRHGVTHPKDAKGTGWFWPDQAFRDLLVSLVVFGLIVFFVMNGHAYAPDGHEGEKSVAAQNGEEVGLYEHWAKAGRRGLGAPLDAPAAPASEYMARPEWYFLFLFQTLKYFEGDLFLVGAIIIPSVVGFVLFLLPLFGFGGLRWFGHIIGVVFVVAVLTGAVTLTCLALASDTAEEVPHALLTRVGLVVAPVVALASLVILAFTVILPSGGFRAVVGFLGSLIVLTLVGGAGYLGYAALYNDVPEPVAEIVREQIGQYERADAESTKKFEEALAKARNFRTRRKNDDWEAGVAIQQALRGTPVDGRVVAVSPQVQGPKLFLRNCASCHSYGEFTDAGWKTSEKEAFKKAKFIASDLAGFGTKEWIHSFLLDPAQDRFYGRCKPDAKGKPRFFRMKRWVDGEIDDRGPEKVKNDFGKIAAWLAEHPTGKKWEKSKKHKEGYSLFVETYNCVRCHGYEDIGRTKAPDLTGYASPEWLTRFLHMPDHPSMYGGTNNMPAFRNTTSPTWSLEKEAYSTFLNFDVAAGDPEKKVRVSHISDVDRALLARFLASDHRLVFNGRPIAGPEVRKDETAK